MKPCLVVPIIAALVGFGIGWLAKPAADTALPKPSAVAAPARKATDKPVATAIAPRENPAPSAPANPVRDAAAIHPAAERVETGSAAKMQRLAEVLGLSAAQQASLSDIIAETQQTAIASHPGSSAGPTEMLDHLAAGSAALEKSLAAVLTPEQSAAFTDLRNRQRDNRIETTAQRELADLTEVTDLSAAQRDKVLARLRQSSANEVAAMPASLALILDSSVLPLGSASPSAQSIQTLSLLADSQTPEDPVALHAKLMASQRRQLDERLNLLKDILTPAQLAQYRAAIAEQRAFQETMTPPQR